MRVRESQAYNSHVSFALANRQASTPLVGHPQVVVGIAEIDDKEVSCADPHPAALVTVFESDLESQGLEVNCDLH